MDKVKLICLTKTHDGAIFKEYKGETDYHYIVIRDAITEVQFGMAEREFEAIQKAKTIYNKPAPCFWDIKLLCDSVGLEMPEDYYEI